MDKKQLNIWKRIQCHLNPLIKGKVDVKFYNVIKVTTQKTEFYISRNRKFRIKGILDWVYYNDSHLAQAIKTEQVDDYYNAMLLHPNSTPNCWENKEFEQLLKDYYHERSKTKHIAQYS